MPTLMHRIFEQIDEPKAMMNRPVPRDKPGGDAIVVSNALGFTLLRVQGPTSCKKNSSEPMNKAVSCSNVAPAASVWEWKASP